MRARRPGPARAARLRPGRGRDPLRRRAGAAARRGRARPAAPRADRDPGGRRRARRPHPLRLRPRLAHRREPALGASPGTTRTSGAGGRPPAHAAGAGGRRGGARPRRGPASRPVVEAIWRDSYEAEQHLLHLGRVGRAGLLDAHRLRQRLPLLRRRARDLLPRGALPRQGRRGLPRRRRAPGRSGATAIAPHLPFYQTGLSRRRALRRSAAELKTRRAAAARPPAGAARPAAPGADRGRRADRPEPGDASGCSISPAASRRSTRRCSLTGESGVGKERVARFIHDESARAGAPLRRDQLRRRAREPARVGALRPRPGRLHRRDPGPRPGSSRPRTAARCCSTRSARSRPPCR